MTKKLKQTTPSDNETKWDNGELGQDATHVKVAPPELDKELDDDLGLQAISIRLEKHLIADFKFIAKQNVIGYQTLMREALKRFAEGEYKRIAIKLANDKEAAAAESIALETSRQSKKAA